MTFAGFYIGVAMGKDVNKIEFDNFTLFLFECPKCGTERIMDGEKALVTGGVAGLGIVGVPYFGILGFIATLKAMAIGTIAVPTGMRLLNLNSKLVEWLHEKKLFECPKCKCSKIVISKNKSADGMLKNGKDKIQELNDNLEKKMIAFDIDGKAERFESKMTEMDEKYQVRNKYGKMKKQIGSYFSKLDEYIEGNSK